MKKTLRVDEKLLREAKIAVHARTDTETVKLGLGSLIRRAAYALLSTLSGNEPRAIDVPRLRED